ncbi:MAG: serine/threonine protein phosphatase [Alphaproteobacteria bacterium]|nr:MAG: serine/threonine protein phosphatase [Alphaproteobacteria bacterium]
MPAATRHSLPDDCVVYAIGDIHGRLDLLNRLLANIREDRAARPEYSRCYIVFLGDYVDRGFQSREVLEHLNRLKTEPHEDGVTDYVFLAGNHEDLMLGFLEDPLEHQLWLAVGGVQTLASYGVPAPESNNIDSLVQASDALVKALPRPHREFLSGLRTWWRAGSYLFVHAGVRPGVPLEKQRRRDLLCIRQEFTNSDADFGFKVVHGHTGVPDVTVRANRIAVDTGAFATGKLSAIALFGSDHAVLSS